MQNTGLFGLLATYQGRINRAKYWTAALIYLAINIVLMALGFIMFGNSLLALSDATSDSVITGVISKGIGFILIVIVIYIPMFISAVFVGIKRLHDRDKSGWWLLVFYLLPAVLNQFGDVSSIFWLIGLAVSIWGLVELGFLRGTAGPNRFGPDPLNM